MDEDVGLFFGMLAVILALIIGVCWAFGLNDNLRTEAVKRGHAEWSVTPEGKTTWQWKEVPK